MKTKELEEGEDEAVGGLGEREHDEVGCLKIEIKKKKR